MAKLEEWVGFSPVQQPQKSIVALWGFSGVGKSQLASAFVKRQRDKSLDYDIFWLRGDAKESFGQSVVSLLKASTSSVDASSEPLGDHQGQRTVLINSFFTELKKPSRSRWLLVVDDMSSDTAMQQYVHGCINCLPHGSVILITRSAEVAARYHRRIEVKGLPETDAITMFSRETDEKFLGCDEGMDLLVASTKYQAQCTIALTTFLDVLELSMLLNCHPLSLKLAASAIMLYPFSISEYISRWKMRRLDESRPMDKTVLRSFEISFEELDRFNPLATKLLTLFAFLDHRDMWYDLCLAATDEDADGDDYPDWLLQIMSEGNFHDYYLPMRNLSFVEAKPGSDHEYTYELHPAIHDYARWRVRDSEEEYIRCAISLVAAKVPRSTDEDFLEIAKRLEPHADQCKIYMEQDRAGPSLDLVELEKFANLFRQLGRYEEASHLCDGILDILRNEDQPDQSTFHMIAGIENNLGLVYHSQRKYDLALQAFNSSYNRQLQLHTPDQDAAMSTIYNKGRSLLMLGNLDDALQLLHHARQHFTPAASPFLTTTTDENHRLTNRILNDIGEIHLRKNDIDQAEQYFTAAFDSQKQIMPLHPSTFAIRLNMGRICLERLRFETANKIFTFIISTYTEWWGRGHFETMRAIAELADSYLRYGETLRLMNGSGDAELSMAGELWRELLGFYEEMYGKGSDVAALAREKLMRVRMDCVEDMYSEYY